MLIPVSSTPGDMDRTDLQRLFSACDVNKSGRIEYDDFIVVCKELSVPSGDVQTLFCRFDQDGDGCIDFSDFSERFNEVSERLDLASFGDTQDQKSAWDQFLERMNGEVCFLGRTREQLTHLYQRIHASGDTTLLRRYEAVIESLEEESRDQRRENQQLARSLRRLEEVTAQQLTELEEDLQERLAHMEKKSQEWRRLRAEAAEMEQRHEGEMADLQAAVERLRKHQEDSWRTHSRMDVYHLKSQIREMALESDELRRSLLRAQGNICILQTEVEKLSSRHANERANGQGDSGPESSREEGLQSELADCPAYSSRIQVLQEMNQKLHDRSDGLGSALSRRGSGKWRIVPNDEDHLRKLKPIRQSTLNYSSFANEDEVPAAESGDTGSSRTATWVESYLDSGLSLTGDANVADSSSSEYDSDDSQDSGSDLRSEGTVSMAASMCSSVSSTRRRLSAFQEVDEAVADPEECVPVYRLVLAGDAGSGKSSFLLRLSLNDFRMDMQTTLGVDFQVKKMLVDGERTDLQIWDTAGQERFRSVSRSYFRKAQGECAQECIPMCVIGNKADLRAGQPEGTCMYNALFCETSAKEGTNVVEAVLHLAREVKKTASLRRTPEPQRSLNLADEQKSLISCCGV
ncbi:hypothetical protein JZ751_024008 [Albula glossodonta]|uniref:EF-hand domain-containing protein n=1 Tax=Albula glossodonta TaxID=121402 RepID=A0A8T2MY05_9TELE|nr:hypothetical protein JZ751_024008 [Albula glossodonta]